MPQKLRAGAPCVAGTVTQDNHRKDKFVSQKNLRCMQGPGAKTYSCAQVPGGFPSGMCASNCNGLSSSEICAPIAGANFTDCLIAGHPFERCLDGSAFFARGRCNHKMACRNDYVCARVPGQQDGNCTPAYFLFQIRLDGHASP